MIHSHTSSCQVHCRWKYWYFAKDRTALWVDRCGSPQIPQLLFVGKHIISELPKTVLVCFVMLFLLVCSSWDFTVLFFLVCHSTVCLHDFSNVLSIECADLLVAWSMQPYSQLSLDVDANVGGSVWAFAFCQQVTGRDSLKDRPPRPVKIAESDIDVSSLLSLLMPTLWSWPPLSFSLFVSHKKLVLKTEFVRAVGRSKLSRCQEEIEIIDEGFLYSMLNLKRKIHAMGVLYFGLVNFSVWFLYSSALAVFQLIGGK